MEDLNMKFMDSMSAEIFNDYFHGFKEKMINFHLHDYYEISLVLKGKSRVLFNGKLTDCESIYLHFFPPNTLHQVMNEDANIYERYNVCFYGSIVYKTLFEFLDSLKILKSEAFIISLNSGEADKLLYYIRKMKEYEREGCVLLLGLILINIGDFYKNCGQSVIKSKNYIHDVLLYIEEGLQSFADKKSKMSAVNIANHFYVSRAKLDVDFKKETSMTLNQYINLLRIKIAKILLCDGCNVSETSRKSGFKDDKYFIRSFKKHVGITPLKYAKGYNSNNPEIIV